MMASWLTALGLWATALTMLVCPNVLAANLPLPLKPGAGVDVATAYCNACHTSNYIIMNSIFLTADQWKGEVTKMRTAFGAPIDDETAAAITAYLSARYAVATKP
jgi:mono/diheme cytochrome c family protein